MQAQFLVHQLEIQHMQAQLATLQFENAQLKAQIEYQKVNTFYLNSGGATTATRVTATLVGTAETQLLEN